MLSINKRKLIVSLSRKKQRESQRLFVAEGVKLVSDLIAGGVKPKFVLVVESSFSVHEKELLFGDIEIVECQPSEMKEVSLLSTPSVVLGVFHYADTGFKLDERPDDLILMLDGIQDPGNMGTIVRVADWFGIRKIVCSHSCVDIYNPKVVQSTMGAIARVAVVETDLAEYLKVNESRWQLPVYGTFLEGRNIYTSDLAKSGFIVMGSEGSGISSDVAGYVTQKLLIPSFPVGQTTSESLNVSTATAIVCSEFRRR
jgi:TrmH family RNA methyltransferase